MTTAKQKKFIRHYLKSWNGTESAQIAGYAHPAQAGSRLLKNDKVRAEIDQQLDALQLGPDAVVIQLSEIARGVDLAEYAEFKEIYRKDSRNKKYLWGEIVSFDIEQLKKDGKSHLIKGIKQNTKGGVDVEFYDRIKALDKIAKYHGLYTKKIDLTTGGVELGESINRALDLVYGKESENEK